MRPSLHFITCGSVDDGKSTLIGRLLWESKQVFDDQASALAKDSIRYGTQGESIDMALLVDGLQAEREQSITIDVAYRFFSTQTRRFVVADTPGHEQYTRNMVTGASNSDLAVLVVNATRGLQVQTHRHARIVAMLGIRHLVMAINKMDLVAWDQRVFDQIVADSQPLIEKCGFKSFQAIPVSALRGDNITSLSPNTPWYAGHALLPYLESIDVDDETQSLKFIFPVQYVNRAGEDFRGYCGRLAGGKVKVGDLVRVVPGGMETKVRSIVTWNQKPLEASRGESITICLEDELDVSRGDVITAAANPIEFSDQFEAKVVGLSGLSLVVGRTYIFNLHTCQAMATITAIKHSVDVQSGQHLAARSLEMNEIGVVTLSLDRPVAFEPYSQCRQVGGFILVDRHSNQTVAAGMIEFALRRAANIHWQHMAIDKKARAQQKLQKPRCIWLTGLSGSGKSTIASLLEKRLFAEGQHTYVLDGDNIRHGLSRDLGFTEADRVENIRRIAEVARLLVDAGLVVIVSFISPYRSEREMARSRFEPEEFLEVFVDATLEECERRDPKGLYAKARRGELRNFTGIDSTYEPPVTPDIRLDTIVDSPEKCVERILLLVHSRP